MKLGMAADAPLVQQLHRGASLAEAPSPPLPGLLGVWDGSTLHGVTWAQLLPGRTATIWPPWTCSGDDVLARRLAAAAVDVAAAQGARLAQALVPLNDAATQHCLEAAGLISAADVEYLAWEADGPASADSPADILPAPWRVQHYEHPKHRPRMELALEAASVNSLDCPLLAGVRPATEVLDGYLAAGESRADHWFLIHDHRQDAGCLLLTDHAAQDEMELVYMGLALPWRGRGLGHALAQLAQHQTRRSGRRRLVTTVDTANTTARSAYARAKFTCWGSRRVLLRLLSE
jgi:hypothetical protein